MRGNCQRRQGFSLLEIVLALAVVAVAMSLLSQLVRLASRSAAASRDQTKAQLIAESVMSDLASGVMVGASSGEWELDTTWGYEVSEAAGPTDNLSALTVVVTHNIDVPRPASFRLTQWLFEAPEPVADETTATDDADAGVGGAL